MVDETDFADLLGMNDEDGNLLEGTNLNSGLDGSATIAKGMPTERTEPTEIPDLSETGASKPINVIIPIVSSAGAVRILTPSSSSS
jgi:hypothetical protein